MVNLIQRHRIKILIFAFLFFIVSMFLLFSQQKKQETPRQQTTGQAEWLGLIPGQSTKDEVANKLGKPLSGEKEGDKTTNEFSSTSPTRTHEVIFNKDISVFFKEIVSMKDTTTFSQLKQRYGNPENILYGEETQNGYFLYIYPSKGVAILANELSNTVLEIWYFPQTTINDFQKNWAQGYSSKPENNF